jgi:hypothetical protein
MLLRFFIILSTFALLGLLVATYDSYGVDIRGKSPNYVNLNDPALKNSSKMYGSSQPGGLVIHNNSKLEYSRELSNKVASLNGVRSAMVMLTDRNAYAAILIDNSVNGTRGTYSKNETNNTGTSFGTYDPDTLNQATENWRLASGINNYETVQNHEDIRSAFKQRIAILLRAANPNIHNVFISANRDFINQMTAYAIDSNWGNTSLDNRLHEFNGTANRLFGIPEASTKIK